MSSSRRTTLSVGVAATLLLSAGLVSAVGLPAQAESPTTAADDAAAAGTIVAGRVSVLERATRAAERAEQEARLATIKAAKVQRIADQKAEAARVASVKAARKAVNAKKEAARKAAAERKAAAKRAEAAQRATRSTVRSVAPSSGSTRAIGQQMAAARGWSGEQWTCLNNLWTRESGWRTTAGSTGRAYGIPQALPGSKMAAAGSDWRTNPATQIEWGLNYIGGRYGSPCGAWQAFLNKGWY